MSLLPPGSAAATRGFAKEDLNLDSPPSYDQAEREKENAVARSGKESLENRPLGNAPLGQRLGKRPFSELELPERSDKLSHKRRLLDVALSNSTTSHRESKALYKFLNENGDLPQKGSRPYTRTEFHNLFEAVRVGGSRLKEITDRKALEAFESGRRAYNELHPGQEIGSSSEKSFKKWNRAEVNAGNQIDQLDLNTDVSEKKDALRGLVEQQFGKQALENSDIARVHNAMQSALEGKRPDTSSWPEENKLNDYKLANKLLDEYQQRQELAGNNHLKIAPTQETMMRQAFEVPGKAQSVVEQGHQEAGEPQIGHPRLLNRQTGEYEDAHILPGQNHQFNPNNPDELEQFKKNNELHSKLKEWTDNHLFERNDDSKEMVHKSKDGKENLFGQREDGSVRLISSSEEAVRGSILSLKVAKMKEGKTLNEIHVKDMSPELLKTTIREAAKENVKVQGLTGPMKEYQDQQQQLAASRRGSPGHGGGRND